MTRCRCCGVVLRAGDEALRVEAIVVHEQHATGEECTFGPSEDEEYGGEAGFLCAGCAKPARDTITRIREMMRQTGGKQ